MNLSLKDLGWAVIREAKKTTVVNSKGEPLCYLLVETDLTKMTAILEFLRLKAEQQTGKPIGKVIP